MNMMFDSLSSINKEQVQEIKEEIWKDLVKIVWNRIQIDLFQLENRFDIHKLYDLLLNSASYPTWLIKILNDEQCRSVLINQISTSKMEEEKKNELNEILSYYFVKKGYMERMSPIMIENSSFSHYVERISLMKKKV